MRYFVQPPGASYVASVFDQHPDKFERVRTVEEAEMLVLTGGGDIHPGLYGEEPLGSPGWYSNARDASELDAIKRAEGLFKFGICRGGQLLNVVNGGKLWQHIDGHSGAHKIYDRVVDKTVITSSVHHQQFRVTPEAVIIATCNLSKKKYGFNDEWTASSGVPDDDVEVCYYPKTRALCVQGHPEFGPQEFTDYCFELIDRYYKEA